MPELPDNQWSFVSWQHHHTKTGAPVKAPEAISKLWMLKTPLDEHLQLKNFAPLTALASLQLNMLPFFPSIFFMAVPNSSFEISECVQRSSEFPGSPGHLVLSSSCVVHVWKMETIRIWKASFNRIVSTFDFFNLIQYFTV